MVFAYSHLSLSGVESAGQLYRCEQLQFAILSGELSDLLISKSKQNGFGESEPCLGLSDVPAHGCLAETYLLLRVLLQGALFSFRPLSGFTCPLLGCWG